MGIVARGGSEASVWNPSSARVHSELLPPAYTGAIRPRIGCPSLSQRVLTARFHGGLREDVRKRRPDAAPCNTADARDRRARSGVNHGQFGTSALRTVTDLNLPSCEVNS